MPGVYRVDLFTRQITSPEVDWSYGEPTEMLTSGSYDAEGNDVGESTGAYIIRVPCGPRDTYLRKELLWPYLQEFVDGALAHILNMSKVLGEQIGGGHPVWPYVIHGHYADAGDVAALLSGALNVPMVLTGHSLGRNKLEQLLKQGRQSKQDIDATYKIMRRIEAEELSLDAAELVITSTRQEIDEQWGLYDGFDVKLERVLRARARRGVNCHGRYMPRMVVIPPGMDFSSVAIQEDTTDADEDLIGADGASPRVAPPIWMRHPQWKTDTPTDEALVEEESFGDSLWDVHESSLRLSMDGERSSLGGSLEYEPAEVGKVAGEGGDPEMQDQVKRILSKINRQVPKPQGISNSSNNQNEVSGPTINKYPLLRRRRRLFVIAADCYDSSGGPNKKMLQLIQEVLKAVRSDSQMSKISGFALSTAMSISQVLSLLKSGRIPATDFDALICSSGSEVYYPGTVQCMDAEGKLCADPDYATHIEYRWGYDGVKRTLVKLMTSQNAQDNNKSTSSSIIEEDVQSSNPHCVSFAVKDSTEKLRMRGLRCHLMYCRSSTRYLFVRWGLNVGNMYVIVGERGDTDHEELVSGYHKTVIVKGIAEKGSEELLRTAGSYHKEDTVPGHSPLVVFADKGIVAEEIMRALKEASKAASGM
ncbi:hypothetical protein BHE74_00030097 [Ensete ventricosum]|nr:hypothetical protein GW17_00041019 [Ensete ventricosum]RWW62754.1 hypothetical protein BHE74_00030097 [Ensete ventricosum]RZS04589.1 hypothetical protein BHM03_00034949 [Ensete ventricosum]